MKSSFPTWSVNTPKTLLATNRLPKPSKNVPNSKIWDYSNNERRRQPCRRLLLERGEGNKWQGGAGAIQPDPPSRPTRPKRQPRPKNERGAGTQFKRERAAALPISTAAANTPVKMPLIRNKNKRNFDPLKSAGSVQHYNAPHTLCNAPTIVSNEK